MQAGQTAVTFRQPDSLTAGDLILWCVVNKYPPNGPGTPTGFALLDQQVMGDSASPGADVGDVYATVFTRVSDGTEDAATEVISIPSGNSAVSRSVSYSRSAGTGWDVATAWGEQGTAGNTWSITTGNLDLAAGDVVVVLIGKNSDQDTTHSSHALSASGITFGSFTSRTAGVGGTTQGDDCAYQIGDFPVTAGNADGPVTFTMSLSGSAGVTAGGVMLIRLRESGAGPTPIDFAGTIPTLTGSQGTSFSQDLTSYFTGSETPFSYSLSGTLPAGLSHSAGVISGTPTVGGLHGPYVLTGTDQDAATADSNAFYISLASNPSVDAGYYTVAQSANAAMEHTTASHSFHHAGSWWQMLRVGSDWNLYQESGNLPSSAGDTVDWVSSAHLSSIHTAGQCSVALDAANNKAYVIGFGLAATVLRVLTYSAGAWTLTQSVAITGTGGVGLGTSSTFHSNQKLSVGVDPNGVPVIVAGNKGTGASATDGLHFAWPDSAASLGGTWSSVNIDSNAGNPEADASGRWGGIVSQGGVDYHVISYSDHDNELIRMAWHQVETTLSNYSSGWSTETIDSTISVDNHVWSGVMAYGGDQVVITLAKAGDGAALGRLYCFTSQLGSSMTWTHKRHRVANGPGEAGALAETPSRPVGILDQINGDVYVVYHAKDSHPYGWVGYKKASLAALLAASSDTAVFDISVPRNSTVLINDESLDAAWNAKTPSHPITSGMGYAPITAAVAANSSTGDSIWWASIDLGAATFVLSLSASIGVSAAAARAMSAYRTLTIVATAARAVMAGKVLAAAVAMSSLGSLAVSKGIAAATAALGTISAGLAYLVSLAASIGSSPAVQKGVGVARAASGAMSAVRAIVVGAVRAAGSTLLGTISTGGLITQLVLSAGVSVSTTANRMVSAARSASAAVSGAAVRMVSAARAASVAVAAELHAIRVFLVTLAVSLATSATMVRAAAAARAAGSACSATVRRGLAVGRSVGAGLAAVRAASVAKTFSAASGIAASAQAIRVFLLTLAASLGAAATAQRAIEVSRNAAIAGAAVRSVALAVSRALTSPVAPGVRKAVSVTKKASSGLVALLGVIYGLIFQPVSRGVRSNAFLARLRASAFTAKRRADAHTATRRSDAFFDRERGDL